MSDVEKFILDPACGGRMMWINKKHPNVLYCDIRTAEVGHIKNSKHSIKPDLLIDFRKMPFDDCSFKLVVYDPPHVINLNKSSIMWRKYGGLVAETWQSDIKKGFDECWRVLEDYGILILKWNDKSINFKELLVVIDKEPLFHNRIRKKNTLGHNTYWATFMKIPDYKKRVRELPHTGVLDMIIERKKEHIKKLEEELAELTA